jgi:HAMP domain-containing protein
MPTERAWHRSLYWRIALGSLAVLVVVLVLEAIVFIAIAVRAPHVLPPRALQRLAMLMARELEGRARGQPSPRPGRLRQRATREPRPAGGARRCRRRGGRRTAAGGRRRSRTGAPAPRTRTRTARLATRTRAGPGGPAVRRPRTAGRRLPEARAAGGTPWRIGPAPAGIAVVRAPAADPALAVVVLGGRPLGTVLAELGPWIVAATVLLTLAGTLVAALLVFGPAHRRLRDLENAARRLGAGDRAARASTAGGDEIAAVSAAFNRMAEELTEHIERWSVPTTRVANCSPTSRTS